MFNLVRVEGVEPTHLTVLDPKSSASANSAILACANKNILVRRDVFAALQSDLFSSHRKSLYEVSLVRRGGFEPSAR